MAEQKQTEGTEQPADVQNQPDATQEAPVVSQTAQSTDSTSQQVKENLPTDVSDRTSEQFNKLRDHNKRLYEANLLLRRELDKKAQAERQFAPIQQAQATQQQTKMEEFIKEDPVTGEQFVDEPKLRKAIEDTNVRATRAEESVRNYIKQQQFVEEQKQTSEAYRSYPQLNPETSNFDANLSKRTRAYLLDSMMNPADYQGRTLTFKEAADLARGESRQASNANTEEESRKREEQKRKEGQQSKEQASASATGVSSSAVPQPSSDDELRNLQDKSRKGDAWAIARRLTWTDHVGTPSSSKGT